MAIPDISELAWVHWRDGQTVSCRESYTDPADIFMATDNCQLVGCPHCLQDIHEDIKDSSALPGCDCKQCVSFRKHNV